MEVKREGVYVATRLPPRIDAKSTHLDIRLRHQASWKPVGGVHPGAFEEALGIDQNN